MSPDAFGPAEAEIRKRFYSGRPQARPFVVGLCGAQGSGKSTLAEALQQHFAAEGVRTVVLSLDDLYLPKADRERLAAEVHPLLRTRGVPGTHDVALGLAVIEALGETGTIDLPRFDKSVDDCLPSGTGSVTGPVELVLLEGWCVGAAAEDEGRLIEPVNGLEREDDPDGAWRRYVNQALAGSYQALFARLDMLVLLAAPSFDVVARWRLEQEAALRARLLAAGQDVSGLMDEAGVQRFVAHYERITRHILREMPGRADLTIALTEDRKIQAARWAPD